MGLAISTAENHQRWHKLIPKDEPLEIGGIAVQWSDGAYQAISTPSLRLVPGVHDVSGLRVGVVKLRVLEWINANIKDPEQLYNVFPEFRPNV